MRPRVCLCCVGRRPSDRGWSTRLHTGTDQTDAFSGRQIYQLQTQHRTQGLCRQIPTSV